MKPNLHIGLKLKISKSLIDRKPTNYHMKTHSCGQYSKFLFLCYKVPRMVARIIIALGWVRHDRKSLLSKRPESFKDTDETKLRRHFWVCLLLKQITVHRLIDDSTHILKNL